MQGELCLGENIADLGGVKLSHIGFQRFMKEHANAIPKEMDGLTMEQRFFCAWATIWRNVIRKEAALKRVVEDRKFLAEGLIPFQAKYLKKASHWFADSVCEFVFLRSV